MIDWERLKALAILRITRGENYKEKRAATEKARKEEGEAYQEWLLTTDEMEKILFPKEEG